MDKWLFQLDDSQSLHRKWLAIAQANKKPPVRFFEIRTNKFHFSGEVRALKFVSMVFFWGWKFLERNSSIQP